MGRRKNDQTVAAAVINVNKQRIPSSRTKASSESSSQADVEEPKSDISLQDNEHSKRRISSRAIRRKKFDDEVVDNSNAYSKKKLRPLSESVSLVEEVVKEPPTPVVPLKKPKLSVKKNDSFIKKAKYDDVVIAKGLFCFEFLFYLKSN